MEETGEQERQRRSDTRHQPGQGSTRSMAHPTRRPVEELGKNSKSLSRDTDAQHKTYHDEESSSKGDTCLQQKDMRY